ncbi:hypothetical protein TNIN_245371 [Trichonephila inaurata madagascariensis]|uniref:Uncharacterized protein n=1 Tax=Trichonephila inaurata madagascariensis TaxID=2747483 RepID=A0A8X6XZJ7_9ARAC|nr:hypothetical protein TNIN_245371 [Trichonephila inaurata madagascariensis]
MLIHKLSSLSDLRGSHTNQLLKSYTQQDTDDWDIGVTSCTRDRISSLLGLQFCLSEAVTQAPSLVRSKWQLLMQPINE